MASFKQNQSLKSFQEFIQDIYSLPDERLFSISDLLSNQQRFTMRALKGIRKNDKHKVIENLLISFSWAMAVANRLHIDSDKMLWKRFPYVCSYCGHCSCVCKKQKIINRKIKIVKSSALKPKSLSQYQQMFEKIYPAKTRTIADAGIHLAEEMGELSEAVHTFLGEHTNKKFKEIEMEFADYLSCIFAVMNSVKVNIAAELEKKYFNNCHVCHNKPCSCNFVGIAEFKS